MQEPLWDFETDSSNAAKPPVVVVNHVRAGPTAGHIALGVAGGILIVLLVVGIAIRAREQAAEEAAKAALMQWQRQEEVRKELAVRAGLAEQARNAERLRIAAIAQRQREELRRDQEAEQARRAKAWARYYKPATGCTESASVECANDYIRAKRAFEAAYAAGKL